MAAKKSTKKEVAEVKVAPKSSIILGGRITEKAAMLSEKRAYTFNVAKNATKKEIAKAIKALYNVTPEAVRTAVVAEKKVMPRGKSRTVGVKSAGKKAYVYLKKGDTIEVL